MTSLRHRQNPARRSACALAIALAASSGVTCLADSGSPFESEIARLAGRSAKQCGIFKLADAARDGWQCVQAAERAGQPYWLAFMGHGEDSMAGEAAIRTPAGEHVVLGYDSNPAGHPRVPDPRFTRVRCPAGFALDAGAGLRLACAKP